MKTWQLLKQAIPDGRVDEVAKKLGVHGDTIRRWRREPESDDAPTESGRRNPLDRTEDLIDVIFLVNPDGAHLVANHPADYYESIAATHALLGTVKSAAALALQDMVRAANAISLDAPLSEIEAKVASAQAKLEEVKRHVRVNYASARAGVGTETFS